MKHFYLCCIATALLLFILPNYHHAQSPDLGVASSFAVFTAVGAFSNNGNSTVVTGDVGTNVGAFNAFPPGLLIGNVHVADPVSAEAAVDVADAYSYLAGLTCSQVIGPLLGGGQILNPGIYCIGEAASLTGNLILDAGGDPDAIFIFQINGALTTGTLANVVLINGASICNIWWQVNGGFSLGDGSSFRGNVLANGAISLLEGSNLQGRILSQAGAIDLHNNIVSIGLPAIAAVISADGPLSFCEGDSVILSGNIDGTWNNGSVSSSITVSTSGDYFVINTTLCGSDSSNIISVTVIAGTPPEIICPPDLTIDCDDSLLPANTGTATATDTCDSTPVIIDFNDLTVAGTCPGNYMIIRTWTATDGDGNTATCDQTISIMDIGSPLIICPPDVTIACTGSTLPDNTGLATSTDNCDANPFISYTDQITPSLLCVHEYVITRLWTATDSCGNSSQCMQTITIEDNTPPVISCPADVIIMCNTSTDPAVTGMATSLDNCDSGPVITFSDQIGPSGCPLITRTWVATDACGNSSSCEQLISQQDSVLVTINCPIDVDIQCAQDIPLPDITLVVASSSCPGVIVITHSGDETTAGSCPNNYTVTRTYVATDACGNTATCVQIISIDDDTPPMITCPVNISVQCTSDIPVPDIQLLTSDNCGGIVQVAFIGDVISGQICPNQFTIIRTYQATDACGNSTLCTQTIQVNDTSVPVMVCPANVTLTCGESILPANTGTPIVSDNCNGATIVSFSDAFVQGDCPLVITRTWLVSDDCGNSTSCEQIITRESNGVISILCPADISVQCASSVPPVSIADVQATISCGMITVSFVGEVMTNMLCADQFILVRTYLAVDECGNSATCNQSITVTNNLPPVMTCPADLTLSCDGVIPVPDPATVLAVSNCGEPALVNFVGDVTSNGACENNYTISRTYLATDACGNTSSCVQLINIQDNTPPLITCPVNITVQCVTEIPVPNLQLLTSDNCGGSVQVAFVGDVISAQICPNQYTITRTYQATDACGNSTLCAQIIEVDDNTAPMVSCPADVTLNCGESTSPLNTGTPILTENCGGPGVANFTDVSVQGNCPQEFVITRTWSVSDSCGNSASCAQIISMESNGVIVISCPGDITVQCASAVPPVNLNDVQASVSCGLITVSFAGEVMVNQICDDQFILIRTFMAVDECGNSATCSQSITVANNILPVINCPADLTLSCDGLIPVPDPASVLAVTSCGEPALITFAGDLIGNTICANSYTISRTYLATDACGNTASCIQLINILDNTPPLITCPVNITVQCVTDIPAPNIQLTTSDNCGGIVQVAFVGDIISAQICPNQFTITRSYQATDACGNSTLCTQIIEVDDTTAPMIVCPSNVTLNCGESILPINTGTPIVSDNCNGATVVNFSDVLVQGNCPQEFVITRTWLVSDGCGNSMSCDQLISVENNNMITILCPSDITVQCASSVPPMDISVIQASASCGPVTVNFLGDMITGMLCADQFTVVRTYQAIDECGNSATCSQLILVQNDILPVINCPANLTVACESLVPLPNPQLITGVSNCGEPVIISFISDVISNVVCDNNYTITRTYRATDGCGNSSDCNQLITVFDDIPPSIVCPVNITVTCASNIPAANISLIISSDNCSGLNTIAFVSDVITNQLCSNQFTVVRTYRATDVCGNSSSCQQMITVFDNSIPVITCPANVTVTCPTLIPPVNVTSVTTSSSCNAPLTVSHVGDVITNQTCVNQFILLRTYRVLDDCGNSATCVQVITVLDNEPPAILFDGQPFENGDTYLVQCFGQDPEWDLPGIDEGSVTVADNCSGEANVDFNRELLEQGNCMEDGFINRYILTWTASDACGNSSTAFVFMELVDTIPPVIVGVPFDITVSCDAIPELPILVYATDECLCACVIEVNETVSLPGCQDGQVITRTWSAKDRCGNESQVSQRITLVDDAGPSLQIILPEFQGAVNGSIYEFRCNEGGIPAMFDLLDAQSIIDTGECGGGVSITFEMDRNISNNCAFFGFAEQRTYTWRAEDECGNESMMIITARVMDDESPVLLGVPEMACIGDPLDGIEAVDNCGEPRLRWWETNIASPCGSGTAIRRTYEAIDNCGNAVTDTVILISNDQIQPAMEFVNVELRDMHTTGSELILECQGNGDRYTAFGPGDILFADACMSGVTVSFEERIVSLGDCDSDDIVARLDLQWSATDLCGNVSLLTIQATIVDNTGPLLVGFRPVMSISCGDALPELLATDNCGHVVISTEDTIIAGSCEYQYSVHRQISAVDACGNITSALQIVHVGSGGLAFTGIEQRICDDVTIPIVTAYDACGQEFVPVRMEEDTLDMPCGDGLVIERLWIAADICGGLDTVSQIIVINDHTPPVIIIPARSIIHQFLDVPENLVFTSQSKVIKQLNALNQYSIDLAEDCEPFITAILTVDTLVGNCLEDGYMEQWHYTWTATDICGNSSSISFAVDIMDDVPPVVTNIPADTIIVCEPLPVVPVISYEDVAQPVIIVYTQLIEEGSIAGTFIVTRRWTFTDACGNATEVVQVIQWTPETLLSCEIVLPPDFECNSHGIEIGSIISGASGSLIYDWEIAGEKCFIQGGQGTPQISIYTGWSEVKIILNITDTFGCVTMCMITVPCTQPVQAANSITDITAVSGFSPGLSNEQISESNKNQFMIWPNPARDIIQLSFESGVSDQVEIIITNYLDQVVYSEKMEITSGFNMHQLDLNSFPQGNYLVRLKTSGEIFTKVISIMK